MEIKYCIPGILSLEAGQNSMKHGARAESVSIWRNTSNGNEWKAAQPQMADCAKQLN
jgi:hypothetical protein